MGTDLYDDLSVVVLVIAAALTLGVAWMWLLYFGPDNPAPRARFLAVLCVTNTIVLVAVWALAWLAERRLTNEPSLGPVGGIILVFVILVLAISPLITIAYLFWLRRLHRRRPPRSRPFDG